MRYVQKSITLIELILVMVLLVLIMGVTITVYPNLRVRARLVKTLVTLDELEKAIRTHEALKGSFPDEFDSITDESPLAMATLRTGMDLLLERVTISDISGILGVLPDELIAALNTAGFTTVLDNTPGATPSETFDFVTPELIVKSPPTNFVRISDGMFGAFGLSFAPSTVFLVFGIGDDVSFLEKLPGIASAPVHESYVESENDPNAFYSRYLAIFELKGVAGFVESIRLMKVVAPSVLPGDVGGTIENYKKIYDSF